jgi:hypothetical protein
MGLVNGVQHVFVISFGNKELVKIPDSYMVRYALREVGAEVDLCCSGNKAAREMREIAVRKD